MLGPGTVSAGIACIDCNTGEYKWRNFYDNYMDERIDIDNYTIYSGGVHSIEAIIINAIENNLQVIGITDHHKAFF